MKKFLLVLLCMTFITAGVTRADERLSVIATAPIPLQTATKTNTGLGLSLAAVKIGPRMEIGPLVSVQNVSNGVNSNLNVVGGVMANLCLWNRMVVGIGEVQKPGTPFNFQAKNYTPSLVVGIRL